jgi:bifunctional non-homologous end joining protein LigD
VPRAHPGAPVATPLDWGEVKPGLRPAQFHLRNAVERFDRLGDLFAPVLRVRQQLDEPLRKLAENVAAVRSYKSS